MAMAMSLSQLLLHFLEVEVDRKEEVLRAWKSRLYDAGQIGGEENFASILDRAIENLEELKANPLVKEADIQLLNNWVMAIAKDRDEIRSKLVRA